MQEHCWRFHFALLIFIYYFEKIFLSWRVFVFIYAASKYIFNTLRYVIIIDDVIVQLRQQTIYTLSSYVTPTVFFFILCVLIKKKTNNGVPIFMKRMLSLVTITSIHPVIVCLKFIRWYPYVLSSVTTVTTVFTTRIHASTLFYYFCLSAFELMHLL